MTPAIVLTVALVVLVVLLLALFIRAVRRENRRQNAILRRFDREKPVREPGLRSRDAETATEDRRGDTA